MEFKRIRFIVVFIALGVFFNADAQQSKPVDYVKPLIGVLNEGACSPGPCLPNSSVYPSPNTIRANNGGYAMNERISGFAQLHAQGTGGLKPYGNFLISPQIGLRIKESQHQSSKAEEVTSAYYYKVRLRNYRILCEFSPAKNSVLYKFTFPASDSSIVLLDVARKIGADVGLDSGSVKISDDKKAISGGGIYFNNWPDAKIKWKMYFYAEFSQQAIHSGVFEDTKILAGQSNGSSQKKALGAYLGFKTKANQEVFVKIAVSFISTDHAKQLLHQEIPAWNFEAVKNNAKSTWNQHLSKIQIDGSDEEKNIFYTHLYHAFVQPRNRTGNNLWKTSEEFWDDHYTLWDSWKTLFPLMTLIDHKMVASNITSFINRHKYNGYVTESFINGKECAVGQGGNTVDNIIGDAFVKKVPGINWEEAYKVLKYNADSVRTPGYQKLGYMYHKEPSIYSFRVRAASATIAFAVNDYCISTVAKGLGKNEDYEFYKNKASNWKNVWNSKATSDGYSGFIMAKNQDGSFDEIDPKKGYNNHFYEGTCWEYSYEIPHDVKGMVEMMGGRQKFIERLKYAMDNLLIDFGNEPSFMTPWLFANENVQRPDLTSYYIRTKLLPLFTLYDLPGDDDQGAMASLYIFSRLGFFPFAGTDKYYLHGTSYKKAAFNLSNGKKFIINAPKASPDNIYIKSVKLNNKNLNRAYITHNEIMQGGTLDFEMTKEPVNFIK